MTNNTIFRCPNCRGSLIHLGEHVACVPCGLNYLVRDGIPILLLEEAEGQYGDKGVDYTITIHKQEVKDGYSHVAKCIEQSGIQDNVYFLNLGYVSDGSPQYAVRDVPLTAINKNSVKLFLETTGDYNFNGKDLLEVGCGRGGNLYTIHQYYETRISTGIDLCMANIKFCQSFLAGSNISFAVADAEKMPFADNSFDVIVNIESSSAYTDIKSFYHNVHRVLRTGGFFLYADVMENSIFDSNIKYLQSLGMEQIRYTDITMNVLLSCYQEYRKKILAYKEAEIFARKEELEDFIGMPGSKIYNSMKSGRKTYRIYHFRKRTGGKGYE